MNTLARLRLAAMSSLLPVLVACSVGPDFHSPQIELAAAWTHAPRNAGDEEMRSEAVDVQWWGNFHDPILTSLVERIRIANLDVQSAASRLEQSRAARGNIAADRFPAVSVQGDYAHARSSADGLLDPSSNNGRTAYNLWQSVVDAGWELDLWGRVRREVEAADARVDVAQESARAALISVTAETAQDYIQLRGVQHILRITRQNLALVQRSLALTKIRFTEGVATTLEVADAAARTAETEARVPALQRRQSELINALSLLLAEPPQSLQTELHDDGLEPPTIPEATGQIAIGLPSQLAERRPDIRRSEAVLHAATADIGIAQGSFYPRITLSGNFGFQALQLADFGSWSSRSFAIGPGFSLPLFEGGRLRAIVRLKQAQQLEAALNYRKTVLAAWHEVDDAMTAYRASRQQRDLLAEALSQSRRAWAGAQQQFGQGSADFLSVLNVQNGLLAREVAWSDSRVSTSLMLVALYKALGGGWQQASQPDAGAPPSQAFIQQPHQEGRSP